MKRNVLIAHNDYRLAGGEGAVAENEARLLRLHGHQVTEYRRDNAKIAGYGALQKLRLAFATLFSWKTYREARALIREQGVDVVHVHNTVPLISPSIYYAAWAEHVPVVQTVHNYRFLCPNGMFYRDGHICEECLAKGLSCAVKHACYRGSRAQSLLLATTIGLHRALGTYRRIDAYICLTPFAKEKLSKVAPASRIHIKPNTVNVGLAPISYGRRDGGYVFLGRLDAQKGVWTLLRAFAELPQLRLTVIGTGPEEDAMRNCVAEHALTNVTMMGQLSRDDALTHVARARALIMPTLLYEGMPLTVLEAFALGTPVIGSAIGSVNAMLTASGGGFTFDQTDPDALVRCITQCTQEQLSSASANALLAFRNDYNEDKNYETLLRIYDAAAENRSARP